MIAERKKWHRCLHLFRDACFRLTKQKRKHILFFAPMYFHYLHIEPLILEIIKNKHIQVSVVKWDTCTEKDYIPGVNFMSLDDIKRGYFDVYDCFFTTEYIDNIWWFGDDVIKIFLLHGVGPKSSYIKSDNLKTYDYIFSPGPEVYRMQSEVVSADKICKTGLPVTDSLVHRVNDAVTFSFEDQLKPVLLYAPSWSSSQDMVSLDEDILQNLKNQDVCNVVIKPHPLLLQPKRCNGVDWLSVFKKVEGRNLILYEEKDTSIYEILKASDYILGDISSVLYEFMVLDRPVLIYADEGMFEHYGSMHEYESLMSAVYKIEKASDLKNALLTITSESDLLSKERHKLLSKTFYSLGSSVDVTRNQLFDVLDITR